MGKTAILAAAASALLGVTGIGAASPAPATHGVVVLDGGQLDRDLQSLPSASTDTPPHVNQTVIRILQAKGDGAAQVTEANVNNDARLIAVRIFGEPGAVRSTANRLNSAFEGAVKKDGYRLIFARAQSQVTAGVAATPVVASPAASVRFVEPRELDRLLMKAPSRKRASSPSPVRSVAAGVMRTPGRATAQVTEVNVNDGAKLLAVRLHGGDRDVRSLAATIASKYGKSVAKAKYALLFSRVATLSSAL